MEKIQGVIFDWAGTTVDFGCFAPVQAFLEAFRSYGLEPTLEEIRKPMGMLKKDHVRAMLTMQRLKERFETIHHRPWEEEDVDRLYEASEREILNIVANFTTPKPYVLEAVRQLREQGIRIGSTTGYTDEMMNIVAAGAKEQGYAPDVWYSPNSVNNAGRPYPYMIFENMKTLHLSDVNRIIKVGDTVADIREGKQAGVITVGIVEGSSVMGLSEEEFDRLSGEEYQAAVEKSVAVYRQAGADYTITHMGELVGLIDQIQNYA